MTKINLENLINIKQKKNSNFELNQIYIGKILVQFGFVIIRYNKKIYYFHNIKQITQSYIDEFLENLIFNADDNLIKSMFNLSKIDIIDELLSMRLISNKNIVKSYLLKSCYNDRDESALNFLKLRNVKI